MRIEDKIIDLQTSVNVLIVMSKEIISETKKTLQLLQILLRESNIIVVDKIEKGD